MTRDIGFVVFPGFQLLDATGPISAFEIACRYASPSYRTHLISADGGPVTSSAGVTVLTTAFGAQRYDTILVAGGHLGELSHLAATIDWLRTAAPEARRTCSVCSGAFLLAEAGLLEGRRVTTHWSDTEAFKRRYPAAELDADRIFIRDGSIWTSGGITAGIDLALALIEEDLGAEVAKRTAQTLVVHHRRFGGQSQFSTALELGGQNGRFSEMIEWMRDHLRDNLAVDTLAGRASMSPRNFARAFLSEIGVTPAKAVERLRLEAAKAEIEFGVGSVESIAEKVGFRDPERMRRAFIRAFGQPPQALRRAARSHSR